MFLGFEFRLVYNFGWLDFIRFKVKVSVNKLFEFICVNWFWIILNIDSFLEIKINILYIFIIWVLKLLKY